MPRKINKPCKRRGCARLTISKHGYCDEHTTFRPRKPKLSSSQRGYGSGWRKLRTAYMARYPFCTFPGCQHFAEELDHIKGLADGGNSTFNNVRGYCRMHHRQKSAAVDYEGATMSWQEWEQKYPIEIK